MARKDSQRPDTESLSTSPARAHFQATPEADARAGTPVEFGPGDCIGRYTVRGLIGAGGMGRVYAAVDPELGRTIALKLIRADRTPSPRARARLLREAQALALLHHPNVVTVHEVDTKGEQVFVAMELVEGPTLTEWLRDEKRGWREVLRVFVAAGRGLEAAHASGIVHRDFKPANVIVGKDRVVVVDFGLARAAADEPAEPSAEAIVDRGVLDVSFTLSNERVGTLAYMAPEQVGGREVTARADQFSFCVALWEALSGKRPADADASPRGREGPARLPRGHRVPASIRRIVERGLAPRSDRRWPDMAALLAALERHLVWRTRRAGAIAVLVVAAAAAGGWLALQSRAAERVRAAQELGRQGEQIRRLMWAAHLMPLHDIKPERDQIAARIPRIEAEMADLGDEGRGPGEFALGAAYLAMGDRKEARDRARKHLEAAWAAGERRAELAFELGSVLAREYQVEEQHARPLDAEARERREAELRRTLRDPAISYLRRARGADTSPDYVEALIALTELRFDDAIAHGEAAFRDVPTLYEAGLMVANALSRKATDALRAGEERQAAALQDRMLAMYQRVADIGRSDERVYRHYADYVGFLAYQRWENGEDVEAEFTRAVELATKGQAADSEAVWADEMIARILWAMGQNDRRHQRDPRPRLVASLAAGAQALARDPRSANAFMYLGNAWSTLAEMWEEPHGIDPRPSLEKSIAAFEAAQSIAPDPEGYANVAASYAQLAHWQMAHGVDPISSVEVGVRSYKEAFRMLPDDMPDAHPNACNLLSDMASHLISLGRDPEPWFARAEPDCAAGKREAPGLPFAFEVAARFEGLRAVAAWRAGRDPMPFWERSLPDFEAALKLDPRREDFRADLASSLAERADFATAHGLDATEAVARALAEARRAVGIDETSPYALRALARASLAAARARVRAGKDPSAAVAEGTQAAERALGQNRDDGEALMVAAELHLVAAPRRPRATGPGLALTARSLALNPGNTRALAIRAGFERLAGDHARADATLAAALAAGPLLANDPVAAR